MIMAETEDRPPRRAGPAAALPARGLHRAVPHHGRAAGDHPPARPAAARIPAARGRARSPRWRSASAPTSATMQRRAAELSEANPMLGHRGCRLGITYPEIYEMQARAIFEAAVAIGEGDRRGAGAGDHDPAGRRRRRELEITRAQVDKVAQEVFAETGYHIEYYVGTMIELPRAALTADKIAEVRRLLQLRHQRPDADRLRPVARRRRQVPAASTSRRASCRRTPSSRSTSTASARWCEIAVGEGPHGEARPQARHLRRAWRRPGLDPVLRARPGWTTSPARPTACRSRGWRRRRRR